MRFNGMTGMGVVVVGVLGGCSSSSGAPAGSVEKDGGITSDTGTTSPADAFKIIIHDAKSGTDATQKPETDATADAKDTKEAAGDALVLDTGLRDTGKPDAAALGPAHVLVTFTGDLTSETVAVNVTTKAVDGRMAFAGFGITDARNTASLFLLEQNADIVAGLESATPWRSDSTWNVAMTDAVDGGSMYSAPSQVVQLATKTYVIRYDRNDIAVIDTSTNVDGGTPTSSIDLSQFVQGTDSDGLVEMTAAVYVPTSQRLYVVLANVNQVEAATYGGTVVCSGEVSTVIAIDTQTDAVVSLGGTGPGGSIPLTYYDPVSVVYDATGDRLLVVGAGCYAKPVAPATTPGAPTLRGVEALALTTGKSSSLIELSSTSFPTGIPDIPTGFVYIDATHAVLGFDQTGQAVYLWNPSTTALGALVQNAPDIFTYDGNGHLLGTRVDASDAGVLSTAIVSVAIPGGASTTLGTNVSSLTGSIYVGSVDVWPHP